MDRITPRDTFWACVFGALAYGTFYLWAIIMLALRWRAAWHIEVIAAAAAGVTYLSFFMQLIGLGFSRYRIVGVVLTVLSILLGAAAGFYLLWFMLMTDGG
jgi:hypothetical protein